MDKGTLLATRANAFNTRFLVLPPEENKESDPPVPRESPTEKGHGPGTIGTLDAGDDPTPLPSNLKIAAIDGCEGAPTDCGARNGTIDDPLSSPPLYGTLEDRPGHHELLPPPC